MANALYTEGGSKNPAPRPGSAGRPGTAGQAAAAAGDTTSKLPNEPGGDGAPGSAQGRLGAPAAGSVAGGAGMIGMGAGGGATPSGQRPAGGDTPTKPTTGPGSGATGEWVSGLGWVDWTGGGGGAAAGAAASGADTGVATPEKSAEEKQAELEAAARDELAKHWSEAGATTQAMLDRAQPDDVNIGRVDHIDDAELRNMLRQIVDAQKQQSENQINYGVEQGVNELNRAVEDAAQEFQTQRNQATADEMQALDNQALYAEARGDRGGIGQAQYASIQNTAATNRFKVNQAQTKLSTDTARQVADLRAQGEFDKANALLEITQSYLGELKSLEQWALQTNLSVDEFNTAIDEWEAEFNRNAQQFLVNTELSTAQVTGAFANGTPTLAAQEQLRQQLAAVGQAMMEMGLTPTPAQIEAMGYTQDQYDRIVGQRAQAGAASSLEDIWGYGGSYYNATNHEWDAAQGSTPAAAASSAGNSVSDAAIIGALDNLGP